jgi:AcrR family transcriptional regulator
MPEAGVNRAPAGSAGAGSTSPARAAASRRTPTRLPRERRERDILAAARAVFCERGYAEAGVAEIAARAQVVEGTLYKYFDSKRVLLERVLEGWYEGLLADYARHLPGIRGTRARLRYMIWRHLRTVRDDTPLARLVFLEVRAHDDYAGSTLYALNRRYTGLLGSVLSDGIAAGELRADVPARVVRDMVYGGLEHLSWRHLTGRGRLDIDREADDMLRLLWDGIAAPGHQAAAPEWAALQAQVLRLERAADRLEARSRHDAG